MQPDSRNPEVSEEAVEIARAFHDEYEAWAVAFGWETQEQTRTGFFELPEANRKAMLATVQALLDRKLIVSRAALDSARAEERERIRERLTLIFGFGADRGEEFLEGRKRFYDEAMEELKRKGLNEPADSTQHDPEPGEAER